MPDMGKRFSHHTNRENPLTPFKLNVGPKHITIDFYAGDSTFKTRTFELR